jgi:hypothetical protein
MKIELSQEHTCYTGQDKCPATNRQQSLRKTCGHEDSETDGPPPNTLQFLEQIQVGVRVAGDVFFDQSHSDIEATNTIGIVASFHNAHQFLIHDERGRFQSIPMLAEWEFNHIFTLKCKDRCGSNRKCPGCWFVRSR